MKTQHTPAERRAAGKAARKHTPRRTLGSWQPAEDRDPLGIIHAQAPARVAELLPLRYARMGESAFAFYRGGAAIMAADLASLATSGITVQACGDAHISNFGLFSAPDRRTVFDLNDFDETLPGPWEWDVARLVTSVEICARERGFDPEELVESTVAAYHRAMSRFADMGNLDVWYTRFEMEATLDEFGGRLGKKSVKSVRKLIAKARAKDSQRAVGKLTEVVDGQRRIIADPPVLVPLRDLVEGPERELADAVVREALSSYLATLAPERASLLRQYRYQDAAMKVVGVGSVGLRAWMVVFEGNGEHDPLVLQIKEARPSALAPYLPASEYAHHGQRVIEGQHAIQATADILLGWTQVGDHHFYVRQLWNGKGSIDLDDLSAEELNAVAVLSAVTLARAHARTGDRLAIAGYLGKGTAFERSAARFARAYADQNETDWQAFRAEFL
ncbi:DUF2252 domain-containing protein [Corynebacterium simulans]|uniref:DUF2252 domain-containing protein n=1 Tax=Corynebacterium simulans TaxID=146827 RepID=UPI001EF259B7|nr:DUF2252 domain-containing protein [Corynebacterium simulans]